MEIEYFKTKRDKWLEEMQSSGEFRRNVKEVIVVIVSVALAIGFLIISLNILNG